QHGGDRRGRQLRAGAAGRAPARGRGCMSTVVADRDTILALVPHAGAMCLWDAVQAFDPHRVRVTTQGHRDPAHPPRGADGRLRARAAGSTARPGLLVALRGVVLHCARIDDLPGPLEGEAELLIDADAGWQYAFRITHQGRLLAEGRVAVMPGNEGADEGASA